MKYKAIIKLYISFLKIGGFTFGGGMAMLPNLKHEVVDVNEWVSEEELLDIFAIGQCTPGVIAINTATFVGYRVAGFWGSIAASIGEVTLPFIIITVLAGVLGEIAGEEVFTAAMAGVRVAVCALIACSVYTLAKKSIIDIPTFLIFLVAFISVAILGISAVPCIVLGALAGYAIKKIGGRR